MSFGENHWLATTLPAGVMQQPLPIANATANVIGKKWHKNIAYSKHSFEDVWKIDNCSQNMGYEYMH